MEVEPIRDAWKIAAMRRLLRDGEAAPRNELLFLMGVNTALRIGDLLRLDLRDVFDEDGSPKSRIDVKERKTGKPRSMQLGGLARKALADFVAAEGAAFLRAVTTSRCSSRGRATRPSPGSRPSGSSPGRSGRWA
jgi:integrase